MKIYPLGLLLLSLLSCTNSSFNHQALNIPLVSSGKIARIDNLQSEFVDTRNIDIWLPEGYSPQKKYAVIYMHDGQMLFDSTKTWNKQEWKVDEVVTSLLKDGKIRECIVVGVWNNGEYRHAEYFPQKILESLPPEAKQQIIEKNLKNKPQADNYLKFLVDELKPLIDSTYSTLTDAQNTFIMGSSMGGVISIYAICEYPHIFGGAGCLSTHWPLVISKDVELSNTVSDQFRNYLKAKMPLPEGKKIYFDYGNKTLDSLYKPYQILVDEIMIGKDYSANNWVTLEFVGEEHSERSWSKRLNIPFEFLLKN